MFDNNLFLLFYFFVGTSTVGSLGAAWPLNGSYASPTAASEPYPISSTYQPSMAIPYSSSLPSTGGTNVSS